VILGVKDASLGEMLAKCGLDSRMLAVYQAFLTQERRLRKKSICGVALHLSSLQRTSI
jgi:hypothetical protein